MDNFYTGAIANLMNISYILITMFKCGAIVGGGEYGD